MAVTKAEIEEALYQAACARLDEQLKARTSTDEVTYFSVEGLPFEMRMRICEQYGGDWTIIAEYCPGEYDDLWFS